MKRQQRFSGIGRSPKRAGAGAAAVPAAASPVLAIAVSVLVVAAMFATVVALPGCASESNDRFQPGGRAGVMRPPPGPSVYEVITRLELEPEQLPAVRAVLERAEDEREDIQNEMFSQTGDRPDPSMAASVRERMDAARTRTESDLSELLTSDQMAEYREMMEEASRQRDAMRSQMGGRPGGGRGGKGGRGGF